MTTEDRLKPNRRILVIDDNPAIHDDLRKVLARNRQAALDEDEALLFGAVAVRPAEFQVDSAYQGEDGLEAIKGALSEGRPYALAFVDVRMPPGWDGVETIRRLKQVDPQLQFVICTAYSDYSWKDIIGRLGHSDDVLILKKPFDNIEVVQLAHALTMKWQLARDAEARMAELGRMASELQSANQQITRELAERARAEEAFRTIFEASPVAITLMDENGRFVDVNGAFEQQHGVTRAVIVGLPGREFGLAQDLSTGVTSAQEVTYMGPAGGPCTALVWRRAVVIANSAHQLQFWLDITERKRMEEDIRTARVAAEAASQAKSDFLANMSHEIRTPINGMLGFTQLVLATELSLDQRDYLETVEGSTKSLLKIISEILDFSKAESGQLDLEQAPLSIRDCVEDATRTLFASAQQKGLALGYEISGKTDLVLGDIVRLRQVLLNIIENAIKFTPAGSVRISVTVSDTTDQNCDACFRVQDTGIGIPRDKQQVIFEPFRQSDNSTTRRFGGTGLGLAISVRIVEKMGGRIWVESEEGGGSTFLFTVPFRLLRSGMECVGMSA